MPVIRQGSFAAGELAPILHGRTDLAKFAVGAKRLRNFWVSRTGAAVSRPGTVFCHAVKNSGTGKVKLIPFVYDDTTAFVLEFGNLYVRFYQNGALVLNGGNPLEVVTPYVTADLQRLQWAQIGAVLTITHPGYPPAELTYAGGTSWSYAAISFDRPANTSAGPFLQYLHRLALTPAAPNIGSGTNVGTAIDFTSDNSHQIKGWGWQVTEVRLNSRGIAYESAPFTIVNMGLPYALTWNPTIAYQVGTYVEYLGSQYRCTSSPPVGTNPTNGAYWTADATGQQPPHIQWDPIPTSSGGSSGVSALATAGVVVAPDRPVLVVLGALYGLVATDPNFIGYRVYRGQGGLYGWVGDTKDAIFVDEGDTPDYTRTPPQGTNPFKFYNSSGVLTSTEYPACVAFFEGRRVFAGTINRPGFIFASAVNDYANFDKHAIPVASDAIQFEIASRKREQIRSLAPVGPKLFAPTQFSAWRISGSSGVLQPSDIDAKSQGEIGSAWLMPLVVEQETALIVRTKGTGVRAFSFDYVRQGYVDSDLSLLSPHLFINHNIVDWAYAEDPFGLALAVRDDGVLLNLTYVKEQDVVAWSWSETPGGNTVTVGNVTLASACALFENVCAIPEGNEDAIYVVVNRGGTRYVERFASRVLGSTPGSSQPWPICLDCSYVYNSTPTTTITGLSWLAGKTVWALVDGAVDGPLTVSGGGVVTLTNPGSYVVVGLLYTPQTQLLPAAVPSVETKTLQKEVVRIAVSLDNTRGLASGPDFQTLREWQQRQVSDGSGIGGVGLPPLFSGDTLEWEITDWGPLGEVCIQQNQPLPITILGVARELKAGDGSD